MSQPTIRITVLAQGDPVVHMGRTTPARPRPPRGNRLCAEPSVFSPMVSPYQHFLAQELLFKGGVVYPHVQMIEVPSFTAERAVVVQHSDACIEPNGETQVVYVLARSSIYQAMSAQ